METGEQYRVKKHLERYLEELRKSDWESREKNASINVGYGLGMFLLERAENDFPFIKKFHVKIHNFVAWVTDNNPQLIQIIDNVFGNGVVDGYSHRQSEELTQIILEGPQRIIHRN
jgi:hypothetical protein